MLERRKLGGAVSALKVKTKAVEMGCESMLQRGAWLWVSTRVWAGEGLMMYHQCLWLHSLTSLLPPTWCLRSEQVAQRRGLVSLLNWYSLAHHCHLFQFYGNTMVGSMVVSFELAYVVVPKRRKQPIQQQGIFFFFLWSEIQAPKSKLHKWPVCIAQLNLPEGVVQRQHKILAYGHVASVLGVFVASWAQSLFRKSSLYLFPEHEPQHFKLCAKDTLLSCGGWRSLPRSFIFRASC